MFRRSRIPGHPARHGASSVARALPLGLAAVCLLAACSSMTRAQREARQREEERKRESERVARKSEEKVQLLTEKEREIQRRLEEMERRQERERKVESARQALFDGRPQEALRIIDEIFAPREVTRVDPETGETTTSTEPPPVLEPAEKAPMIEVRALAFHDLDDRGRAIEAYQEVVKLDSSIRSARKNLGKLLFLEKRWEEALEAWQLELDDGYWDAEILYLMGQAQFHVGETENEPSRYEAARVALQAALLKDPGSLDLRRWLAHVELVSGRFEEYIRQLEGVRREYPLDAEWLERLANAYIQIEDFDRAIDYLELAARLRPRQAIFLSLGDLYARRGSPSRASEWFLRAYQYEPARAKDAGERLFVGRLLAEAGLTDRAVEWLESVGRDEKEFFEAQSVLATSYQSRGQDAAALAAFENMRQTRPQDGLAHLAVGDIHLDRKELEEAFEAYTAASVLAATKADGLAGLAEVAYARGNLRVAILKYREALEERPGEKRFEVALRQIEEELRIKEESEAVARTPTS